MRLNLGSLQQVVKKALDDEKSIEMLKTEINRVMGPVVVTEGKIEDIVAAANDRLDVLEHTGRTGILEFKSTTTMKFMNHEHPEVRKFAARVVPEKFLSKMTTDRNADVRAAVARRVPSTIVREMMKRFPSDDQLRSIMKVKRIEEAGLPKPKIQDEPFDMYGEKRLGDIAKTASTPELSDQWYITKALMLVHDYGQNIEGQWEEHAVKRFCASVKALTRVEVDADKLLKSVQDVIKEKEDMAMDRNALKETLAWLTVQGEVENLNEGILPEISEEVDPVQSLVENGYSDEQLLDLGSRLFKVQESMLPMGIRKYRLGEGNARQVMVPCIGMLPSGLRSIDERALDAFCEAWTRRQAIVGESLRLEWYGHPSNVNKIGFTCVLK